MSKIQPARAISFLCACLVLAVFLNGMWAHWQQSLADSRLDRQQKVEAKLAVEKAARDAVAEHANFLTRYLIPGVTRKPGTRMLGFAVASEDGNLKDVLADVLALHLQTNGVETVSSVFRPSFVTDGLFADAYKGSAQVLNSLELANSTDALLLAREIVDYSTNDTSLQNVISAEMHLQVALVPVSSNVQAERWTLATYGAGFSPRDARTLAEQRLIKAIGDDTNMTLARFVPKHPPH